MSFSISALLSQGKSSIIIGEVPPNGSYLIEDGGNIFRVMNADEGGRKVLCLDVKNDHIVSIDIYEPRFSSISYEPNPNLLKERFK